MQAPIERLATFAQHGQPKYYAASDMMRADLEALIVQAIAQPVQPAPKLLTPGQIEALIEDVFDTDDASLILFARAVEAAHGITNPKETK